MNSKDRVYASGRLPIYFSNVRFTCEFLLCFSLTWEFQVWKYFTVDLTKSRLKNKICIQFKPDPHLNHSWVTCEYMRLFCTGSFPSVFGVDTSIKYYKDSFSFYFWVFKHKFWLWKRAHLAVWKVGPPWRKFLDPRLALKVKSTINADQILLCRNLNYIPISSDLIL